MVYPTFKQWNLQEIGENFGTHELKDILVGIHIIITYIGETKETNRKHQSKIGVEMGAEKLLKWGFELFSDFLINDHLGEHAKR